MSFDPQAAAQAWAIANGRTDVLKRIKMEGLKKKMFAGTAVQVTEDRIEATEKVCVPFLCFPFSAFLTGSGLPKDVQTLPKTSDALRTHVRPDGAVFLGLFETPGHPETGVIVFGDAETPSNIRMAVSCQYRDDVMAEAAAFASGMQMAKTESLTVS